MSEPEIIENLPFKDYLKLDAVSNSMVKVFANATPRHYYDKFLKHDVPDFKVTDAMNFGSAMHCMLLEPAMFNEEFAIWYGDRRSGKEYKDFKEEAGKKVVLTESQFKEASKIQRVLLDDPGIAPIVRAPGKREVTLLWTDPDTNLRCKARLDKIVDGDKIIDLKTTKKASPRKFAWTIRDYGYDMQDASYSYGFLQCFGKKASGFEFVAFEKDYPYIPGVYTIAPEKRLAAFERYKAALVGIAECSENDDWPGYTPDGPVELNW